MEMMKLEEALKKHDHRNTRARRLVFEILERSQSSLTAREIFDRMNPSSGVDLASIYRNLELFQELKLVHRFQDGSFSSCHHEHHHEEEAHLHFISLCNTCGHKSEISHHSKSICDLARKMKKVCKDLQTFDEIIIQGQCSNCQ